MVQPSEGTLRNSIRRVGSSSPGCLGSGELPPPGVSTVEVSISRHNGGTSVEIVHSGLTQPESSRHVAGWRHFLERVAQTVERQGVENSKGR
jgi:hypothetical protein